MSLSRRQFLGVAGAAALGCGGRRGALTATAPPDFDVAIVGGGLSGLVAARDLVAGGARVAVLEALDRVGGRTWNQTIAGTAVEAGGQWIGPTQTAVVDLVRALGLETFPTYDRGDAVISWRGQRLVGRSFLDPDEAADVARAVAALEQIGRQLPPGEPWRAADAARWDAMTVATWLDTATTTAGGRLELETALASTVGGAAREVSLLWFAFYVASAGGFHALEAVAGGAQEQRVVGGSQRIALELAIRVGDSLHRRTRVRRIEDNPGRAVRLELDRGALTASRVVVAMSPRDAARLEIAPPARERAALGTAWRMAPGIKAHVAYAEPFWRAQGLSGQAATDGPIEMAFDNSPPSGTPGILVVFTDPARAPGSASARRARLIDALVELFGEPARAAIDYVECDWASVPTIAGCVSPLGPGVLTRHGPALRAPIGRIHFAGTETSAIWNGYMEGAVRAGQRAASEVLAALGSGAPAIST